MNALSVMYLHTKDHPGDDKDSIADTNANFVPAKKPLTDAVTNSPKKLVIRLRRILISIWTIPGSHAL